MSFEVTILEPEIIVITNENEEVTVTTDDPSPSQAGITFEDEGVSLGTRGTVTELDFVGTGVAATRVGDKVTVTVSSSGGDPAIEVEGGLGRKITDMTAITAASINPTTDLITLVDTSDTTDAATGTNKKVLAENIRLTFLDRVKTSRLHGPVLIQAPAISAGNINFLKASPFIVWNNSITIDQIALEVTTGTTGNVVFGIYDDLNGYPNALLHSSGAVAVSAPAVLTSTISPSITLRPGLYWTVSNMDTANSFRVTNITNYSYDGWHVFGRPTTGGTTVPVIYLLAQTYGSLPNPFTASAAISSATAPYIMFRIV